MKSRISHCYLLVFFLIFACDGSKYRFQPESMHWLQFRGPNCSGIAPEDADPPIFFSADSNVLWKTDIPSGWSSPCIVNERIFLTGFSKADSVLSTFCLNRENGEILWDYPLYDTIEIEGTHAANTPASSTICSDGTHIYSFFGSYGLQCFNLAGELQWDLPIDSLSFYMGSGTSPVIYNEMILLDLEHRNNPRFSAIDKKTGEILWEQPDSFSNVYSRTSHATPVIWKDQAVLHHYNIIAGYSLKDGSRLWWLKSPGTGTATPVVSSDRIFLNMWTNLGEDQQYTPLPGYADLIASQDTDANECIDTSEVPKDWMVFTRPEAADAPRTSMSLIGYFSSIDEDNDGCIQESEWNDLLTLVERFRKDHGMMAIRLGAEGELNENDLLWKHIDDTPETPSPLIVDEKVFFIKNGGIVTLIDIETGDIILKDRLGARSSYLASPMLANDRIYTASWNGAITVISADSYEVLSVNKLGGKIGASPVAVDDVLYVRTDKHMYAFR